ncbi:MAG: hypothetical protein KME04_19850 [Pleurocapsa minor GSE-CHR-MK-17-07R]|jgi:hypothetical protein|nr:hypothetical protein [Pleurocapsa minor GSE-CHR-MK 17-07R]
MGRIATLIASALAISIGLIVLVGLLTGSTLAGLTGLVLQIAVITAAMTVLIGVLNLLILHLRRIFGRERGIIYSITLVVSFLLVIALYVLDQPDARRVVLEDVAVSIESTLSALLVFALVYGAYRLMRRRVTWAAVLFTAIVLITLLGAVPLSQLALLEQLRAWILAVPASAGARGLLLGIALAAIIAGMRVLIGQERAVRE